MKPGARGSHWKLTVLVHRFLGLPSPVPIISNYYAAIVVRLLVFIALNVVFGLNNNQEVDDYRLYGCLAIANGGLALLMGARNNLFSILLRIPSPVILLYHRWIGIATVAHATTHFAYTMRYFELHDRTSIALSRARNRIGLMAWTSLAIMFITALPIVRRRAFEVFYYAHSLFFVFVVGALIHAPKSREFILPGLCLWVVDRAVRFVYNFRHIEVNCVRHYEGNLTKFQIEGLRTRHPGQIVWIQIPGISFLNWHPFTVVSVPKQSEGLATIAVRGLGGFTSKAQYVSDGDEGMFSEETNSHTKTSTKRMPRMRVDGPYGVGHIQWGNLPVNVLVAGGIGITPGISIASHLIKSTTQLEPKGTSLATSKDNARSYVYLIWVIKEASYLQWFENELRDLYLSSTITGCPVTLDITIYTTRRAHSVPSSLRQEESAAESECTSTEYPWTIATGRPELTKCFRQIKEKHAGSDAAVNVCGPRTLIDETRIAAGRASSETGLFYVEEEVFEL